MKKLDVYYKNLKAGILLEESPSSYIFQYEKEYLKNDNARPISVNLPLKAEAFKAAELFPFFDNLIAEGWLLEAQSTALKIDKNDRFALIAKCGLDCIGAISLRGSNE